MSRTTVKNTFTICGFICVVALSGWTADVSSRNSVACVSSLAATSTPTGFTDDFDAAFKASAARRLNASASAIFRAGRKASRASSPGDISNGGMIQY